MMTRRVLVTLMGLLLISCSNSPSAPTTADSLSAFANYEGFWQGEFRYTQCDGDGEPLCSLSTLGRIDKFVLNLRQSGPSVTGLLITERVIAELKGAVATDGQLVMSGVAPAAGARNIGTLEVTQFVMRQESGGLSGSFAYTQKPPAGSYAALAGAGGRYAGEVVSASRRDAPVSSIAARWEGQAAVRECTLSGVRACYPFQSADVETLYLNLEQSGGQVTGDISFLRSGG